MFMLRFIFIVQLLEKLRHNKNNTAENVFGDCIDSRILIESN